MIDDNVAALWPKVDAAMQRIGNGNVPNAGQGAAQVVVAPMQTTFETIKPMDIVEAYVDAQMIDTE